MNVFLASFFLFDHNLVRVEWGGDKEARQIYRSICFKQRLIVIKATGGWSHQQITVQTKIVRSTRPFLYDCKTY